ncbi:LacI family DNA-binding transcriptional regulator [Muricoccus pecuniae]|uniref:LacI family transcriptional regulator n=1 Tax=Muricoccus pecuniae TaxID=693023 RepID=A0A840YD86_9PROT|nr:LacI family DNA-binding transcriptional regulator [Roseomonas pecuniae]MBB5694091.1 LacI family transcriptional regulator [Roseomonas pecuniae]
MAGPAPPPRLTLRDVAARAGVSRATASLVLRESPVVAAETRARVRAAVDALGYTYNRGAAMLRAGRSHTIGLIVTDITNPFFGEMALGVDAAMDAASYVSFLVSTGEELERQERFLQRMREQGVDGVVLCPAHGTPPSLIRRLREWGMPVVQALRHVPEEAGGDRALSDNAAALRLVVDHLVGLGHRRIAYLGHDLDTSVSRDRRAGFTRAMRAHGLDPGPAIAIPVSRRAGAEAIGALLDGPSRPTAVACFNDLLALGAMLGLERRGMRVGPDMAVTGVDDLAEASLCEPGLTTVSTLPRRVGEEAGRLLLRRMAEPGRPPEEVVLPARLVVRASCGAARGTAPSGSMAKAGPVAAGAAA